MSQEIHRTPGRMASVTLNSCKQPCNEEQLTLPPDNRSRSIELFVQALSAETSGAATQLAREHLLNQSSEVQLGVLREIIAAGWQISRAVQQNDSRTRNSPASADLERTLKYHLFKLAYEQPFIKDDQRISDLLQQLNKDGVSVTVAQISAFRAHLKITLRSVLTPEKYEACESSGLNIDNAVHYLIQATKPKMGVISISQELQKNISDSLSVPLNKVNVLVMNYRRALIEARWPVAVALD